MKKTILTQTKANELFKIEKHRQNDKKWHYPNTGGEVRIPLISIDKKEEFILDIWKRKISLKYRYQTRVRKTVILVRLDIGGSPHRNPDNEEIPPNHIHIYKEGYDDKWAYPIPIERFRNIQDILETLQNFMMYCNITKPPLFENNSVQFQENLFDKRN